MDMRKQIKKMAKENDCKVRDLLALTPGNDPMYIQPAQRQKAEWFRDIWEEEGRPEIHPRGLHYRILGKGYETRKGEEYVNSLRCWGEMVEGAKYARITQLVPFKPIQDEQNPDPETTSYFYSHTEFEPKMVEPQSDIVGEDAITADPELREENTRAMLNKAVKEIVRKHFGAVDYNIARLQPNYLEIWSEKSAVIPERIAREAGATIRPAGGGEMSMRMAWDAVQKAKYREKPLHIFLLTDFDPKGKDMPKSVGRKIELLAEKHDIEAFIHPVVVTKEQCKEHALPTTPAREPEGTGTGAKAYKSHTRKFRSYAGQEPVEINSFQGRHPDKYKQTIRDAMLPFFDPELGKKVSDAVEEAREETKDRVEDRIEDVREEVREIREKLEPRLEKFRQKKEELELPRLVENYTDLLDIDTKDLLRDIEVDLPEPETEPERDEPLLDTRRSYGEQIKYYKKFDIRYE